MKVWIHGRQIKAGDHLTDGLRDFVWGKDGKLHPTSPTHLRYVCLSPYDLDVLIRDTHYEERKSKK